MKRIFFKSSLLLIVSCYLINATAQQQSIHIGGSLTLPPSPTPNSLVNQIDQSVQYYTGALNLSIPIHTLKSRKLELPISLGYNSAGIKVNDLASWVGLGWSLNAGGVISRVMHGLPDEFNGQVAVGQRMVQGKGWLDPSVRGGAGQEINEYFNNTTPNNRANLIEFSNKTGSHIYGGANPQAWDTEPDEFYFNFGSHSGKFIFDKSGTVQIIPAQNLHVRNIEITPASTLGSGTNSREITSFQIVDETGTIYTFGNQSATVISSLTAVERTYHHYFRQSILAGRIRLPQDPSDFPNPEQVGPYIIYKWALQPIILVGSIGGAQIESVNASLVANYLPVSSTWHLKKIESANGDDYIDFSYFDENLLYMTSHTVDIGQDNLDLYVDNYPYDDPDNTDAYKLKYYGSFLMNTTPSNVVNEKGQKWFLIGNDTVKISTPFYPQTTTISTGFNTVSAKRLASILDASGNLITFNSATVRYDLNGGHQLDQIDIFNINGQKVRSLKFSFGYTEAAPWEGEVFDIYHDQFVYWFRAPGNDVWWPITEWGNDANANSVYSNTWKQIWEAAVACDYRRLFLLDIKESGDNWVSSTLINSFEYEISEVLPRRLSPKQDSWGYFNANGTGHTIPGFNYNTSWLSGAPVEYLTPATSTNFGFPFRATNIIDSNNKPIVVDPNFSANRSPNLSKAQCGILKRVTFPTGGKKEFTYSLNTIGGTPVGGLRVSSVTDFPEATLNLSENINFQYYNGVSPFSNFVQGEVWDLDPLDIHNIRNSLTVSSSPMNFTPNTKGGTVGYAKVEETRAGLGKKVFYFKNPTSDPNTFLSTQFINGSICSNCPAYSPPVDNDFSRGLLWKTEILNESNQILKRNITNFQINPVGFTPKTTFALKPGVRFQYNNLINPIDDRVQFAGFYAYNQYFVSVQSQTEELFDQAFPGDESRKFVSTTNFEYKLPNSIPGIVPIDLLPRKTIKDVMSGEKLITEIKYASDYTAAASVSDQMVNAIFQLNEKKIVVPIESISYMEKQVGSITTKYLLSGGLNKFKEFSNRIGKVDGWEQYKIKPGNILIDAVNGYSWSTINNGQFQWPNSNLFKLTGSVADYDLVGNPILTSGEDGVTNSYLWGYNGSLLMSAIQNSGPYQFQTNYMHQPLVGLTQSADANGRNSKFVYDNFNRLKLLKDHDDQIAARYRYNYKNHSSYNSLDFTFHTEYSSSTTNTIKFIAIGNLEPGTSLSWDFGDASGKDNGSAVEYKTYTTPGTYTVRLYASNPEYPTSSVSKSLTILPPATAQITAPTAGTNTTVCGTAPVTCTVTTTGGPYTFQWQYNHSTFGNSNFVGVGTNSSTLNFTVGGGNGASATVRCKITDAAGFVRYSNYLTVFYYCQGSGGGGPNDCPSGWTWNSQLSRCEPPSGFCNEGCFWGGQQCICN